MEPPQPPRAPPSCSSDLKKSSSSLLSRVQAFLPQIADANAELERKLKEQGSNTDDLRIDAHLVQAVDNEDEEEEEQEEKGEEKGQMIEMNLALGPLDDEVAEALEGGEAEGDDAEAERKAKEVEELQQQKEEKEEGGEGNRKKEVVLSLLNEKKDGEGTKEGEGEKKKKPLIQEL